MASSHGGSNSNTGGATNSAPQTREEIFDANLRAFREYAVSRGAYYNKHGHLIYRGQVLTKSDSVYLVRLYAVYEYLLTREQLESAFEWLVFRARLGGDKQ